MGKKESKSSLIKTFFSCNSKQKPTKGSHKRNHKETNKGKGTKWFMFMIIPPVFFREPSSIEKILREADQVFFRPASPSFAASLQTCFPTTSSKEFCYVQRPKEHVSATMIQAAYRGYLTRRKLRSLRGLVRLQGAVRGQNTERQTLNTIKQMQLFVRAQTQIQSQRTQRLEYQHQTKSTQLSESSNNEDWDDSLLSKEEIEARRRKKIDAAKKRERAMSYANSHQMWKSSSKSAKSSLEQPNVYPWWWKWLENQMPLRGKLM